MSRILIVNKFFYKRGGDCIYAINLAHLLEQQNHEVAIFAMNFPENIKSGWECYYPYQVNFSDRQFKGKILAISRLLGFGGIKSSFLKLLEYFKPDVVHLNNIHSYLSPIVAKLSHDRGIKVVWTLHDYKLICPTYTCLRNGKVCELCFLNPLSVLSKKCMKKSYIASFFAYIEAIRWSKNNIEPYVDTFICPSNFIADKMIQTGYNKDKICVLCNFIDFKKYNNIYKVKPKIREQAYCYIGRLSEEKGINQLLDVAKSLPYKLYVAGKGPLKDSLEKEYSYKNIIFLGELTTDQIYNLLSTVKCSVMPSVWYENNPLSVIESLCMGTPVLGANIGGIPELINADNGLLFAPNNPNDLREKIVYLFNKYVFCNDKIQATSLSKFSSENYYNKLTGIYNDK